MKLWEKNNYKNNSKFWLEKTFFIEFIFKNGLGKTLVAIPENWITLCLIAYSF